MGFKDFCENQQNNKNNENKDTQQNNKIDVSEVYEKYKNKNENELYDELIKNVAMQKQQGNYDHQKLSQTAEKLLPFLTQEQSQKLNQILQSLK